MLACGLEMAESRNMDIDDPRIADLKAMVSAAQEEFDLAVVCHEVWKPSAFDAGLHRRIGNSYAGHAFLVVRMALRREIMLALARLWDTNKQAIRMSAIAALLRERGLIEALAKDRAERVGLPASIEAMRSDLATKAAKVRDLVNKYFEGGSHNDVRKDLLQLRHERLAHRQLAQPDATVTGGLDDALEEFYSDTSKVIHLLMSLANATAYQPDETGRVYERYAAQFWMGVRSEREPGHPNFRGIGNGS